MIDLTPATGQLAALIEGVRADQLSDPTPCPDYTVGDLVEHVGGLCLAFTNAATKSGGPIADTNTGGDASRLADGWRETIPRDLDRLAGAWSTPDAWSGMTRVGVVDLPGDAGGLVALDELVIHGWDIARASGQAFGCPVGLLRALHGFLEGFSGPGHEQERAGLFGPEVAVPDDAPLLDRVVGMAGRDPSWSPDSPVSPT